MAAPHPVPFTADVDALGHGTITVDGVDVTGQIVGARFAIEPGQPTRLDVYTDTPGKVTGDAYVYVHAPGGAAEAVAALDPAEVERLASDNMQSIEDNPTRATIAAIVALLGGQ